jgi:hypothetical protein
VGGPEGGDGLGEQGGGRAGEGRDPYLAAAQAGDQPEIALGPLQLGQDGVGPPDQRPAGVGEADRAAVALDQPGSGLPLQGGDLLGDGRLAVGERLGGGRERSPDGDLAQHRQAPDIQHKHSLSKHPRTFMCTDATGGIPITA